MKKKLIRLNYDSVLLKLYFWRTNAINEAVKRHYWVNYFPNILFLRAQTCRCLLLVLCKQFCWKYCILPLSTWRAMGVSNCSVHSCGKKKKKKSHIVTECYTENFNDTEIDLFLLTEATFLYRCWRRETVIIALEWKTWIEDFNSSFSTAVIKDTWKSL